MAKWETAKWTLAGERNGRFLLPVCDDDFLAVRHRLKANGTSRRTLRDPSLPVCRPAVPPCLKERSQVK